MSDTTKTAAEKRTESVQAGFLAYCKQAGVTEEQMPTVVKRAEEIEAEELKKAQEAGQ